MGFLSGSERNRLVSSEGVVNQRLGEFWTEILGSGGKLQGCLRTSKLRQTTGGPKRGLEMAIARRYQGTANEERS